MSSFRYNPSATLISLRPMSSKMCYLSPRTTVTHLSGLYRNPRRGLNTVRNSSTGRWWIMGQNMCDRALVDSYP